MNIRREIKLFWSSHSDAFLFYAMVFGAVILITQGLNKMAKQERLEKEKNIIQNEVINETINEITNEITIKKEDDNINKEVINKFIDFCREKRIEEAYNLLSNQCRTEKYHNIESFEKLYYNKIFNQKRNIEIEIVENNIYKVIFYEDMLETGKIGDREKVVDYYKVEQTVLENDMKIYINLKNSIE